MNNIAGMPSVTRLPKCWPTRSAGRPGHRPEAFQSRSESRTNHASKQRRGDAQDLDVDGTFDVVLLGELIEHLTDFDGLLRSIDEHLRPDGKFIVTTPNAMAVHWTALRLLDIEFVNSEHTCWFDVRTLSQLFARYGFEVAEVEYVGDCRFRPGDPLQSVGWICERLLPDRVGKSTLVVVAEKSADGSPGADD